MILICVQVLFAQDEINDPKATAVLDKVKAKYDKYLALEISMDVNIEIPEEEAIQMNAKMIQSGDKYRMEIDKNQYIMCDGESLWTLDTESQECQIEDAEDDGNAEAIMSPKDFLKIYEKEDFTYALIHEGYKEGVFLQQIEFKPNDSDSEYTKIRISVNRDESIIDEIKIFARDGSRFSLKMGALRVNKIYPSNYFSYDESLCEDCECEDLRI